MILVDTSIWVDHLRRGDDHLSALLEDGMVLGHPFIIGELACGSMTNRREILELLRTLPLAVTAEHVEVLQFIEDNHLFGKGVGWIDAHLLASAMLSRSYLWSSDRKLVRVAESLGVAYKPAH